MIDRIIDAETLHRDFIARRKPCILNKIPDELSSLKQFGDLQYLSDVAGAAVVSVEPIGNLGAYGTAATKETMLFSDFLRKLQDGGKVYLTTQYSEDETSVLNEPLSTLRQHVDFPMCLDLVHDLIPAKINLWLGASKTGTSSGLHHDFHDNIYVLLCGTKRFRIFPPSWTTCTKLSTHGKPHELFSNGLISYDPALCADGLNASTKAQIRVNIRESALKIARESGHNTAEAEDLYETAMDQLLDARLMDGDASEDGAFEAPSEFEEEDGGYSDGDEGNSLETEELVGTDPIPSILISNLEDSVNEASCESRPSGKAAQSPDFSSITEDAETSASPADQEPPSFSKLSSIEVAKMLDDPDMAGQEFVLKAGEMLYLPASYFHEVISLSGEQDFHMAVNYWFYPPDAPGGSYEDAEVMGELKSRLTNSYQAPRPGNEALDQEQHRKRMKT